MSNTQHTPMEKKTSVSRSYVAIYSEKIDCSEITHVTVLSDKLQNVGVRPLTQQSIIRISPRGFSDCARWKVSDYDILSVSSYLL